MEISLLSPQFLLFYKQNKKKFNTDKVFFSEFLREDNALYDNLNPSRIIVGPVSNVAKNLWR